MQGTIVKVAVEEGAGGQRGRLVVVLEAMKMEQPLVAHRAGTIINLTATVGTTVSAGTAICESSTARCRVGPAPDPFRSNRIFATLLFRILTSPPRVA